MTRGNSPNQADPNQVVLDMPNARTSENERLFLREERLSKGQIQSYFSRLALQKRKQASKPETTASDPGESLDIEEMVEEEIRLQKWMRFMRRCQCSIQFTMTPSTSVNFIRTKRSAPLMLAC